MEDFSLKDCLIPELLKWKIKFRILRYKNGNKENPVSLIVSCKYQDVCKVDYENIVGSSSCYKVTWSSTRVQSFNLGQHYPRACELVSDIRKVIHFEYANRGEDKMNKKYKVIDMKVSSNAITKDEITLVAIPSGSNSIGLADCDRIKEAIESIKNEEYPKDIKWEIRDYRGGFTTWRNEYQKERDKFDIKDVIFNNPATIVLWADGTKTVVKAENEKFDPEKGLAMAIAKKALGNDYGYYDVFKKYVGRYEKKQKKGGK